MMEAEPNKSTSPNKGGINYIIDSDKELIVINRGYTTIIL